MDRCLCGLRIRGDVPLPDLLPWQGPPDHPPDVRIAYGVVPPPPDPIAPEWPSAQVGADGTCWFLIPAVAHFFIAANGRTVTVAPAPGTAEADLHTFLLGAVASVVLLRHGFLPLHACCVRVGDAAIAFAADSGVGKSTLAAGLWARGYTLLADDLTAVDLAAVDLAGSVTAQVHPTVPRLSLWQETLDRLALPRDGLVPVRQALNKYRMPLGAGFCPDPLPLAAVVILEKKGACPPGTFERLPTLSGLAQLETVLYRPHLMRRLGGQPAQMRQYMHLMAATGALHRLSRPETPEDWTRLLSGLETLANARGAGHSGPRPALRP